MDSEYVLPDSVEDVWALARTHMANREGAHLDALLQQIGDDIVRTRPVPQGTNPDDEVDRTVYQLWQKADPAGRRCLAQLFMRTVGRETFLEDEQYSGEPELPEWR